MLSMTSTMIWLLARDQGMNILQDLEDLGSQREQKQDHLHCLVAR